MNFELEKLTIRSLVDKMALVFADASGLTFDQIYLLFFAGMLVYIGFAGLWNAIDSLRNNPTAINLRQVYQITTPGLGKRINILLAIYLFLVLLLGIALIIAVLN